MLKTSLDDTLASEVLVHLVRIAIGVEEVVVFAQSGHGCAVATLVDCCNVSYTKHTDGVRVKDRYDLISEFPKAVPELETLP